MTDLSVVIVNYNVSYFLEQCLHSVFKAAEGLQCEIFVVDNDSVDGSVAMVREKFPDVKLIANRENVGFSKANNQAMRIAKGRYILLLNPDTLVEEDTFLKSVAFMDAHPKGGGLGVKMIDGQGRFLPESKRGLPTPAVAFYKIFGLSSIFPKSKIFGKYHLGYLSKEQTHEVPILSGAFMLMRKEALDKVGLLDEAFFMYGEDIDLSYRLVLGGYSNYYYPETRIIHYKGESTKKSSVNYVFVFYRAMVIFANKHFSARLAKTYGFLINLAIYFRASIALSTRFIKKVILPLLDFAIASLILLLLKEYYQDYTHIDYESGYAEAALALYVAIWTISVYLSGGYEKPPSLYRILRGILVGTVIILVSYALLPESMRFSRALILLGMVSTASVFLFLRIALHLGGIKGYKLGRVQRKKTGVVANEREFNRIKSLLEETGTARSAVYRISPTADGESNASQADRLQEVVNIYKLDSVIFSGEDVASHRIIGLMAGVKSKNLEFKIAPPESLFIIGSNSIEKGGDLFMMDLEVINKPKNLRKKRMADIGLSLIFLLLSPLLIWTVENKTGFLSNIFKVLSGNKSWVGYSDDDTGNLELPRIQKGVLSPMDKLNLRRPPQGTARKLNAVYARAYSLRNDLSIIASGFKKLGRNN